MVEKGFRKRRKKRNNTIKSGNYVLPAHTQTKRTRTRRTTLTQIFQEAVLGFWNLLIEYIAPLH
jgi:hypothetical protein